MAMYHQTTSGKSATSARTLLAISISQAPEKKTCVFTQDRASVHDKVSKEPFLKKHNSTPRPSKVLLISSDSDRNHCSATQDEYLSHGDVSRGHSRTFFNQSRNLPGNSDFSHTLIETMILQSIVKHGAIAMHHQTTSGKSASGASTLLAISISQAPE